MCYRFGLIYTNMDTEKERVFLELKSKLLKEIEYREDVLSELKRNSKDEKGFVSNFMKKFFRSKAEPKNLFWKDGETYGRYLIDADKDLHIDIELAFEKSLTKLKLDYSNAVLKAE